MEILGITLLWTGRFPIWLAVGLLLALSYLTVRVYARQRLAPPWNRVLPALRIAAFILLLFPLARPVLSRITAWVQRGVIAVLLDNSGSMGIHDQYEPHEQVRIAWHLKLFSQDLRCIVFEQATQALERAQAALAPGATSARDMERAARALRDLGADFERAFKRFPYLSHLRDATPVGTGLVWEVFQPLTGRSFADIIRDKGLPDQPAHTGVITNFETRPQFGDHYATRLTGWIVPPVSGRYTFLISADDNAQVEVWPPTGTGQPVRVASLDDYRPIDRWERGAEIELSAGEPRRVRVIHLEGTGEDHVRVGWRRPDGREELPIPGLHLHTTLPGDATQSGGRLLAITQRIEQAATAVAELAADLGAEPPRIVSSSALARARAACVPCLEDLAALQQAADAALAAQPPPEVAAGLKRLAGLSRWDIVRLALEQPPWRLERNLAAKGEPVWFLLDEPYTEADRMALTNATPRVPATKLGTAFQGVLKRLDKRPLISALIVSDGNQNAGAGLDEARAAADERELPLYALTVGAPRPPRDVVIESVTAPETSFREDRVAVAVRLNRHGFADRPIRLKVLEGRDVRREVTVPPGETELVTVDASFEAREAGERLYTVEAESFTGELLPQNNTRTFVVNVLEDRIRTLLVDDYPRWESRYVRMMLARDRRVELTALFVGSEPGEALTTGTNAYPESREALFGYQVVLLGDVPPERFSRAQLEDLRDFVIERGGALLLLAGPRAMPERYGDTPLRDLLPLALPTPGALTPPPAPDAGAAERRIVPAVTPPGKHDNAVQIGATPELSQQLWEGLPPLDWVHTNVTVAPAADTLVEEADREAPAPLLAKAYAGAGKILYVGGDSFWRWRDRARWRYHHRFWGQLILWATLDRTTGSDRNIKLMTDRLQYAPDENVQVNARLLDDRQMPLENVQATLDVLNEKGDVVQRVSLLPLPGGGGEYRAELRGLPRGRLKLAPRVFEWRDRTNQAEIAIAVGDVDLGELTHVAFDQARVDRWAVRQAPVWNPLAVTEAIESRDLREERRDDTALWDNLPFLALVALLLGLEWHWRKRCRLA